MNESTPRPWRVKCADHKTIEIVDADGNTVIPWTAFDDSARPIAEHKAITALIVRAVNSSDRLVAALADLADAINNPDNMSDEIRAAAERLRQYEKSSCLSSASAIYRSDNMNAIEVLVHSDRALIARQWLREHPDSPPEKP